jgi:nucleoside phosphorylase
MPQRRLDHSAYRVGWICPLEVEQIAAMAMLDEEHELLPQKPTDHNIYKLGSVNNHSVVVTGLPKTGNCSAATVVTQMRMTFPNLRYALLVGIGGGVPTKTDSGMIRLGHVIVSKPTGIHSGAVQYDHGKAKDGYFERTGAIAPPPPILLNAAQALAVQRELLNHDPVWEDIKRVQKSRRTTRRFKFPGFANDHLYRPDYIHQQPGQSCDECACASEQRVERRIEEGEEAFVVVHRGTIASGELVIKSAALRDRLAGQHGLLCFEMEAAGALADFPCLVIRGISDYCDSHKNDQWHGHAAAAAAAYARQLFFHLPVEETQR